MYRSSRNHLFKKSYISFFFKMLSIKNKILSGRAKMLSERAKIFSKRGKILSLKKKSQIKIFFSTQNQNFFFQKSYIGP